MCKEYRLVFENGLTEVHARNEFILIEREGILAVRPVRDIKPGDVVKDGNSLSIVARVESMENCETYDAS